MRLLLVASRPDELSATAAAFDGSPHRDGEVELETAADPDAAGEALRAGRCDAVIAFCRDANGSCAAQLASLRAMASGIALLAVVDGGPTRPLLDSGATAVLRRSELAQLPEILRRHTSAAESYRNAGAAGSLPEAIVEHAPIGIVTTDPRGVILTVNGRFCEMSGRGRPELIGRSFLDLLDETDVERSAASFGVWILNPEPSAKFPRRFRHADGSVVWAEVTLSTSRDDSGRVETVLAFLEEVTARKSAEEALYSSREQLADAQAIANVGSWEYDLDTGVQLWSDQMCRLFGLPPDEPPDFARAYSLVFPDDLARVRTLEAEAKVTLSPFATDIRVRHGDGRVSTMHVSGRFLSDRRSGSRKLVGIVQDITERIEREEEYRRVAVQQAAVASLGQLALRGLPVDALLEQATGFVCSILDVDQCAVVERQAGGLVVRECSALGSGSEGSAGLLLVAHASASIETGDAVAANDLASDPRFAGAAADARVASGLAVPIGPGEPWGALVVHSAATRAFGVADENFLRLVANVIAQVIDRNEAQRGLVESEERYRTVVEGASEVIYTLATDGTIVSLNRQFEAITGWPRAMWLGKRFDDLIVDEDRVRMAALFEAMVTSSTGLSTEVSIIGRDRAPLLQADTFPRIEDGKLTGFYGFARDVTEARQFERERQQLTRSLQLVLDSTVEGVCTVDEDGRCILVNGAAARMLGWDARQLAGRDFHSIVHPQRADGSMHGIDACTVHLVLSDSRPRTVRDDVFWRHDGTAMPVEYSAAPIFDCGVPVGAVVTFTDATERRKLETQLEQASRLTSIGRLAATIAHEFNNTLMGISPFVEVIRRSPERTSSALDQIARSVARGKRITSEILRFTQPPEPVRSGLDVGPWLRHLAAEAGTLLRERQSIELAVEGPLEVHADPTQLHQVLMNLVLNARDATESGVISISASREPRGAVFPFGIVPEAERFAHFCVRDPGSGMSAETLRHIFEPLFTTKKSGTGLGLAITHQLVSRNGGAIFVESREGEGSAFHVFIPLAEPAAAAPGADPVHAPEALALPGRKVLLVEDDEAVAEGIVTLLQMEEFQVDLAVDGASALERFSRSRPDVVLLDVGLPDIDGVAVYQKMRQIDPAVPVIFSTGHLERAQLEGILESPGVTALLKPYDSAALFAAIARVTGG